MTDRIVIEVEPREIAGKQVSQLRRDGWIPGIIYGRKTPQSVQMEQKALRRALRTVGTTHLVDIQLDGKPRTVLIREIQQHATRGDILHVDFMEVDMSAKLRTSAELVTVGQALPEAEGLGAVTLMLREIEIECYPDDMVASIDVDLSAIKTPDDVIHVRDLAIPQGIEVLTDPDMVVTSFEYVGAEEVEAVEEEAVEAEAVEVIARGKKEEEEF